MSGDTWVCCDSCSKWRRIPQTVADGLDENTPWHCSDNKDPNYNNCDAPQELTDVEIDERTRLPVQEEEEGHESDENDENATKEISLRASKFRKRPPVWQHITKNIYMHRERKQLDEDEVMICQCKPIWATDTTTIGCGENCLNRMLNIECVAKYCPCGERCTNRSFTKRAYAKLEVRRAGAKGFGLFAAEDIKAGQFIVEYVGEVLEEEEYARRKEFYIATGQRHYYFMNVGNGEVIDAARRGGLGRFINHSCEPNCETQKWVVRGELAIGLFALEDVSAGTELTFDYNFERYGDKPMKCLCGSKACRGVIGGSQETAARMSETIVAPEDEDQDLQPIMVKEGDDDETVAAILDRAVGLGWEEGFDSKLQARLHRLAEEAGIELPTTGPGGSGSSDEDSGEDSDEEIAAAAAAAKAATAAKYRSSTKKRTPRVPRQRAADPDWEEGPPPASAAPASSGRRPRTVADLDVDEGFPSSRAERGGSVLLPKRGTPLYSASGVKSWVKTGRRSEVDRRLDTLLASSGRLKDSSPGTIVRMLRLFNLCDIGPTISKASSGNGPRAAAAATAALAAKVKATATATVGGTAAATGDDAKMQQPEANGKPAAAPESSEKEEGEVSGPSSGAVAAAPPPPPLPAAISSGGDDEGSSRAVASRGDEGISLQFTARQRARLADMSLLLDVVQKTSNLSARKEFLRCGLLRQLLSTIGRNIGPNYAVIIKKTLRILEPLPIVPDDVHHTRSAHGSFGDLLYDLSRHSDFEVKSLARNLLSKWPAHACQRPVVVESWHSSAASTRTPLAGGAGIGPRDRDRGGGDGTPHTRERDYNRGPPGSGRGGPPPPHYEGDYDRYGSPYGPLSNVRGGTRGPSRFAPSSGRGGGERGPWQGPPPPPPRPYDSTGGYRDRSERDYGPRDGPDGRYYPSGSRDRRDDRDGYRDRDRDIGRKRSRWEPAVPPAARGDYGRSPHGLPPLPHPDEPAAKQFRGTRDARLWSNGSERDGGGDEYHSEQPRYGSSGRGPAPGSGGWTASLPPQGEEPTTFPRAPSGSISDLSKGSGGGGSRGGGEEAHAQAAQAPARDGLMMSPMTDEEDGNGKADTDAALQANGNGRHNDGSPGAGEQERSASPDDYFPIHIQAPIPAPAPPAAPAAPRPGSAAGTDWEDSWEKPNARFEEFVVDTIRRRLRKYEQPDHPLQLSRDEAGSLFKSIRREIMAKEVNAYEERQRIQQLKPLERHKLEPRIKDYVRDRVRKYHASRGTGIA